MHFFCMHAYVLALAHTCVLVLARECKCVCVHAREYVYMNACVRYAWVLTHACVCWHKCVLM